MTQIVEELIEAYSKVRNEAFKFRGRAPRRYFEGIVEDADSIIQHIQNRGLVKGSISDLVTIMQDLRTGVEHVRYEKTRS